jgi:Fe-S-cluster containining protein
MTSSRCGPRWQCITGCGACCRLDPSQRPEALDALSPEQRRTYLAMVGDDGWCIHYDSGGQRCRIYSERPDFCQVANLINLFGGHGQADLKDADVAREGDRLAIACCLQQIRSEYGGRSRVMKRFLRALRHQPRALRRQP